MVVREVLLVISVSCFKLLVCFTETSEMAQKEQIAPRIFDSMNEAAETESASIEGVVACISPMKTGKGAAYFEAKLTDGAAQMRVVGFQGSQRKRLVTFEEKGESVSLQNCQIKQARFGEDLEIMLKSSSRVEASPKKFALADVASIVSPQISLSELSTRATFDKVCVQAKVIRVDKEATVSGEKSKQDVIIADSGSAAKLTLWEQNIGCLQEGTSYNLSNLVVCTYQKCKYLSWPREGGKMLVIEDIGEVVEDDLPDDATTIDNAEVVGVVMLEAYFECLVCKGKVEAVGGKLGSCTKCNLHLRIDHCKRQKSAKLIFCAADTYVTLNAFGTIVYDIAETEEVTVEALLCARPVTVSYYNNVVTAISRS